ncbi:reverse transcriptase domain-containing protein [Tanacetum coccineum]
MLVSSEKSGQVAKWAIKLGEHDIEFRERISAKKQIPKDFSVEMPFEEDEKITARKTETKKENLKLDNTWKLSTDRALSSDGSGAGLMLISPEGKEYTYALRLEFETTNTEAEYEALLVGLRIAQEMEIRSLAIFTDSQLMVSQMKGLFEAKHLTVKQYLEKVKEILKGFDIYTIEHVPRRPTTLLEKYMKALADLTWNITLWWPNLIPESEEHTIKAKRKEGEEREVASIEEAYYQNKLRRYHNMRSNHSTFKLGDFVLLSLSNTNGRQVWQGPHIISGVYDGELYKITNASDYSLVQIPKGTSLRRDYGLVTEAATGLTCE